MRGKENDIWRESEMVSVREKERQTDRVCEKERDIKHKKILEINFFFIVYFNSPKIFLFKILIPFFLLFTYINICYN